MKLLHKLIIFFVLTVTVPLTLETYFSYANSKDYAVDQVFESLENVASLHEKEIVNYVDTVIESTILQATKPTFLISLESYLSTGGEDKLSELRETLDVSSVSSREMFVINREGKIIASTKENEQGKEYDYSDPLLLSSEGIYLFVDNTGNNNVHLHSSTPIKLDGERVGTLIFEETAYGLGTITTDYTGLGETGESLLVRETDNHNFEILTPTRHNLNLRVFETRDENNLFNQIHDSPKQFYDESVDYRDHEVYATATEIVGTNWMFVTKIDKSEALVPVNEILRQVLVTGPVLIILSTIIAVFLSRSITAPISDLVKAANRMRRGDLDTKVKISSDNEIGKLAGAFNSMAEGLRKSRQGLEKRVEERTVELLQSKGELEKQQQALMNLLEDLSEEKELEEMQSESLLGTIGEGIVVTNEKGEVDYVNKAFTDLTGFLQQDLEGKSLADTLKAFDLTGKVISPTKISDAAMVTAKKRETKLQIETKDKKLIAMVINASPIKVRDEYKGVVRVFHDVSEEVKIAQQKDDFFSIASHELRTPLSVIAGNLDTFLEYGKSQVTDEDKKLINDTMSATDRLIKMVNDFLNVSRLDQGRIKTHIVELDACKIVMDTIKDLTPMAEKKNIKLIAECDLEKILVKGDDGFIREIIINLIGNSMKFTKEGEIRVKQEVVGKMLKTSVSDTGMGIDPDKQGLLFQRFQQAMGRTLAREAGGTGLGLYISREFARVMGGELVLEKSELGKGSVFSFTLPLVDKNAKPPEIAETKEELANDKSKVVK